MQHDLRHTVSIALISLVLRQPPAAQGESEPVDKTDNKCVPGAPCLSSPKRFAINRHGVFGVSGAAGVLATTLSAQAPNLASMPRGPRAQRWCTAWRHRRVVSKTEGVGHMGAMFVPIRQ